MATLRQKCKCDSGAYIYLREINVCENTQDKSAYENENTQGKNLLPYNYFFFIVFLNIQSSHRNAVL